MHDLLPSSFYAIFLLLRDPLLTRNVLHPPFLRRGTPFLRLLLPPLTLYLPSPSRILNRLLLH